MDHVAKGKHTELFGIKNAPSLTRAASNVNFEVVPRYRHDLKSVDSPVWRVIFTPAIDPNSPFGLEIHDEVILGRQPFTGDRDKLVDLTRNEAEKLGVSRRHLMLRPTTTNLFVVDLGSTNGTFRNGQSIGSHTPYSLVDGDVITLGKLPLLVEIIERPSLSSKGAAGESDLTDALVQIAKAITSQLNLDEALNQVAETARALTSAGETGIWLVDEFSGELLLEAQRGIGDEKLRRMRLPTDRDTLVGEVLRTTKPVRTSRRPGGDEIKVKTGYLVEALVYVPITLGGVTFGVLSAVHREAGKKFSRRDERLLEAIADFAAIAIQNARLYHRTDEALERRLKELAALNQLSFTLSSSLDLNQVYEVLVEQVNQHWPVEAVQLYLLDEEREALRRHTPAGLEAEASFSQERGLVGAVSRTGKFLVSNDLQNEPELAPEIDAVGVAEPRSMICAPLRVQSRVVGVLALLNKIDGLFTEEDVIRLRAFTNPVATAVENARLYAQSEGRRRAIQATAEILPQPLLIMDESGRLLIANHAAQEILQTNMSALFDGISRGLGRTTEVHIDEKTFLSTSEHIEGVGTITVMQDITYVKQLEADRSDFMHALSHDMRNPLTSIIGYTQVMDRILPPDEDENYRSYLSRIRTSADRMLEMVNQLLQTVDSDTVEKLDRQSADLVAIVSRVIHDVEGIALGKEIRVKYRQEGEPYPVLVDETRLYHAILNLVENAVKYSPEQSEIRISLTFDEEETEFRVADEGPGIPQNEIDFIFEKYYRASTNQPGNGLGLSVVRSIANAHAGSVSAANGEEGGAIFTLTLPSSARLPIPAQPSS